MSRRILTLPKKVNKSGIHSNRLRNQICLTDTVGSLADALSSAIGFYTQIDLLYRCTFGSYKTIAILKPTPTYLMATSIAQPPNLCHLYIAAMFSHLHRSIHMIYSLLMRFARHRLVFCSVKTTHNQIIANFCNGMPNRLSCKR